MAAPLLTLGSPAQCLHGGIAIPAQPSPRVLAGGAPTLTLDAPWIVTGCALPTPCVTAQFVDAARRLTSGGRPLLLADSQSICVPTGTPLVVSPGQTRVLGA